MKARNVSGKNKYALVSVSNKKPLLIAGISLAAIVVLVLLVFFASQLFVGKAFFADDLDTLGIVQPAANIQPGTPFDLVVRANIGTKETVAVRFDLDLPAGLTCNNVNNLLGWTADNGAVLFGTSCDADQVVFDYATLNSDLSKTGTFDLATISFDGAAAGNHDLSFSDFELVDLSTQELIPVTALDTTIEIQLAVEICDNGLDDDNDGSEDCADSDCATDPVCQIAPASDIITLEVYEGSSLVSSLTAGTTYRVVATINAQSDLPAHLFFVKVLDNQGKDAAVHYQSKAGLANGNSETITFDYQVPVGSSGTYVIKAFTWSNWLSLNGSPLSGGYFITTEYEII